MKILTYSKSCVFKPWTSSSFNEESLRSHPFLLVRGSVRPNPSLEPTRYGRHCKPGLSQSNHCLSPGLQYLPTRAAQLER